MSYGLFGLSGTISSSFSSSRSWGSELSRLGGSEALFWGTKWKSSRTAARDWGSESWTKWATPDLDAWTSAPPRSSMVTSSWVTVFTTFGPVTNM